MRICISILLFLMGLSTWAQQSNSALLALQSAVQSSALGYNMSKPEGLQLYAQSGQNPDSMEQFKTLTFFFINFGLDIHLMPSTFVTADSNKNLVYNVLDPLLYEILQSEEGLKICEVFKSADVLTAFIGAHDVNRVAQICGSHLGRNTQQASGLLPINRTYLLFIYSDPNFHMSSWTVPLGYTFLFVPRSEFNLDFLKKAILHELGISLDAKYVQSKKVDPGQFSCNDLQSALMHPMMKHALAALRAFDFENRFFKHTQPTVSCQQAVMTMLPQIYQIRSAFVRDLVEYFGDPFQNKCALNTVSLAKAIELMSTSQVQVDGKMVSACEYFTHFGMSTNPNLVDNTGPRPRVGGSGWDALSPNVLSEIQSSSDTQASQLSKQIQNILQNTKPDMLPLKNLEKKKSWDFYFDSKDGQDQLLQPPKDLQQ